MPSKQKRVRVERGLYRMGSYYHVCATPPGSRTVMWRALGKVRLMEARRLRDKFAAEVQGAQLPASRTRATFGELAAEWLAEQNARLEVGELSPRTYEGYELGLRCHVLPVFGSRQVRGITVEQLVGWIRGLRRAGYAPQSVVNYRAPLRLVLRFAVRRGALPANPAEQLTAAERPKAGLGRQRVLDKHEMEQLLSAATERYRVAIACGLFAGLRLSEPGGAPHRTVWDASHTRSTGNRLCVSRG